MSIKNAKVVGEQSEISHVTDRETFAAKAAELFGNIGKIDPNSVLCMTGIIVSRDPNAEPDAEGRIKAAMQVFVLGDDPDIAKMLTTLVTVARQGIVQAHTPTPEDEVKH